MVVSATATKLGKRVSAARGVGVSTAGPTSTDVLTVNHGLGASPDRFTVTPRSIVAVVSTGTPALYLRSWNASVAVFDVPAINAGAVAAQFDIICEKIHSLVK